MTAQTTAQRQADLRARRAMLGLTEVRGIYLPPDKHKELRRLAKKLNLTVTKTGIDARAEQE